MAAWLRDGGITVEAQMILVKMRFVNAQELGQ
jgi:hypothetical protein